MFPKLEKGQINMSLTGQSNLRVCDDGGMRLQTGEPPLSPRHLMTWAGLRTSRAPG